MSYLILPCLIVLCILNYSFINKNYRDIKRVYNTTSEIQKKILRKPGNKKLLKLQYHMTCIYKTIQSIYYFEKDKYLSKLFGIETNKLNGDYHSVKYYSNGYWHKIIMKNGKHPKMVNSIFNEFGQDVTAKITPYLGPREDFHGAIVYPIIFGYTKLIFKVFDEDTLQKELTFNASDQIILSSHVRRID